MKLIVKLTHMATGIQSPHASQYSVGGHVQVVHLRPNVSWTETCRQFGVRMMRIGPTIFHVELPET